jgi:hypothetical protein
LAAAGLFKLKEILLFGTQLHLLAAVEERPEITLQVVGLEGPVVEEATQMPEALVILQARRQRRVQMAGEGQLTAPIMAVVAVAVEQARLVDLVGIQLLARVVPAQVLQ